MRRHVNSVSITKIGSMQKLFHENGLFNMNVGKMKMLLKDTSGRLFIVLKYYS